MLYYYVMNANGLYLNADMLWQGQWDKRVYKSSTLPKLDTALVGVHEVYEAEEEEMNLPAPPPKRLASIPGPYVILFINGYWSKSCKWVSLAQWNPDNVMTFQECAAAEHYIQIERLRNAQVVQIDFREWRAGKPPRPFNPKSEFEFILKYGLTEAEVKELILDPASRVRASMRNKFLEEYKALAAKYEVKPFVPNCRYNQDGDQLEVYLTEDLSYCEPLAPGIIVMRNMETKAITGVKIQDFLDRLSGADPSRQAMIMDLKFVHVLCNWYQGLLDYHKVNSNHPWRWTPEALEFFRTVIRLWPGSPQKFLQELPTHVPDQTNGGS